MAVRNQQDNDSVGSGVVVGLNLVELRQVGGHNLAETAVVEGHNFAVKLLVGSHNLMGLKGKNS